MEMYQHPWLDSKDVRAVCKFGEQCFNKSEKHLAEFRHPWLEKKEEKKPEPPAAAAWVPKKSEPAQKQGAPNVAEDTEEDAEMAELKERERQKLQQAKLLREAQEAIEKEQEEI